MTEISDQEAQRILYGKYTARQAMIQLAAAILQDAAHDFGLKDHITSDLLELCKQTAAVAWENEKLADYWRTDE